MRRGNSGELSTTTVALNLAGNLARVMTTLVLTQVRHCTHLARFLLPKIRKVTCRLDKP